MTTFGRLLKTRAVAFIRMVTGFGPHLKVMIPPRATAFTTACEVQLAADPFPTTRFGWEVSTARAAGGIGELPVGFPAAGGGGTMAGSPRARWRKAAIWPRVTRPSGQKRPLPQPAVMPAVASRLMAVRNLWLDGTSLKRTPLVAVRWKARVMKAAIWPRVTRPSGQNRPPPHPKVMPAVASRLMAVANRWLDRTSLKRTPLVAVRSSARVMKAAIWPRVTRPSGQKRSLVGGLQP